MPTDASEPAYASGHPLAFHSQDIPWRVRLRVFLVWAISVALIALILVVRLPTSGQVTVALGDVAQRDIVAPRQLTYISDVLTEQRRTLAANAVPDVYDPPQARVGRQQFTLSGQIIEFIASVRSDSLAGPELKAEYIKAIAKLDLSAQVIERIVSLPNPAWEAVASEVQVVLERAMREEIRESNLADERRKIPARVRLDLTDQDAAIVSDIVQDLLVPNSFYNTDRTAERRKAARDAVEPVTTTLERNEVILRAGDIVTELDLEALRALGLQQQSWTWQEVQFALALTFLMGTILLYYLWRQEPRLWMRPKELIVLAIAIVLFVLVAKAAVPTRALIPYVFPYAALTMILAVVLNWRVALLVTSLFALLVGWLASGSVELMAYVLAGSLIGTLKLRRGDRLSSYVWAAIAVLIANLAVVAVFRVAAGSWDWQGILELGIASLINSLLAITLAIVGLYLISMAFGILTPLQLLELSRPTHPLLRQLLLKAPGTYHHTLIVGNMCERAAEAIGADALLTRVGAYYHDVGKTIRPYFFVENRSEGMDPHARLDPLTSAQIIVTHVKDGIDLAHKYRLPQRIADFIPEHHGTGVVSYFYHQAQQQAPAPDAVDETPFRYPGPKPRSRETAITMLADGAEATVRARRPNSIQELDQIVGESIQRRLLSGQLDECPLTAADLNAIRGAFVDVLRGLHHPRINYPSDPQAASSAATEATLPPPAPESPKGPPEAPTAQDDAAASQGAL